MTLLQNYSQDTIGIAIAVLCILVAVLLTIYRTGSNLPGRRRNSQPAIIIAGPPGSGKTALYTIVRWRRIPNADATLTNL